jgi:pyridoxamine 5'-phosphate oxidase
MPGGAASYPDAVSGDALHEDDLAADPVTQFRRWHGAATALPVPEPDAMVVATARSDGAPSARVVLLRGIDERGFVFYTGYDSRKGRDLAENARAALVFHWPDAHRQVRVIGVVERVGEDESDAYWFSRPRASRISAWASSQSEPIESRAALEASADEVAARFEGGEVPRPPNWGGYRVVPDEVEFWQHRDDRLHDRLRYRRRGDGTWTVERLQP